MANLSGDDDGHRCTFGTRQTPLSIFLCHIFNKLEETRQDYCVCGNYYELPYYTDNDVDIWAKNPKEVVKIIEDVCTKQGYKIYLKNRNTVGANLFIWSVQKKEHVILHLDVLAECSWHSFMPLVRSNIIENNRKIYHDFFVANDTIDAAMHLMYPLAHFGKITEKYKKDIKKESTRDEFWKIIESGWGVKFGREMKKLILQSEWGTLEDLFCRRKTSLALYALRQLTWSEMKSFFVFVSTNIERLFQPKGLFIAFIGPDGCGKTTVIRNLNTFFDKGFTKGKLKKFYWRPFLLPRLKALIPGVNKSQDNDETADPSDRLKLREANLFQRITHCAKLFYYWTDYLAGRIKYQGAWSRGGIVCFDRYWDDLLVFPERFGLNVPRLLIKLMGVFVPKPDIVFYLHTEGDILIARKPELPHEEITRHVRDYKHLVERNDRVVLIDGNRSENEVVSAIINACLEKMSERYHDINV